ncbi:MAG: hypothetical protein ACOYKZ_01530 [Chlamydiia bacterium]
MLIPFGLGITLLCWFFHGGGFTKQATARAARAWLCFEIGAMIAFLVISSLLNEPASSLREVISHWVLGCGGAVGVGYFVTAGIRAFWPQVPLLGGLGALGAMCIAGSSVCMVLVSRSA